MKAIRVHKFGGPEVLSLEQLPDLQPGPNQVLIRVRAIGVNPVETYLRSGSNPALALPYTPGTDVAGKAIGPAEKHGRPRIKLRLVNRVLRAEVFR